jgi:GNAT superfamily N-acetyltransferase
MTAREWTLRPLLSDDRDAIVDLFRSVFGDEDATPEWWDWKYLENPCGSTIGVVAEVGTRIVGQYAASPRMFRIEGRDVRAVHGIDLMVDPAYRRQGMFRELLARTCQIARSSGIELLYHTGNSASRPGMLSTPDYHDVFPVAPVWFKPLSLVGLVAAIPGFPHRGGPPLNAADSRTEDDLSVSQAVSSEISVRNVPLDYEALSSVSARAATRRRLSAVRDRAYLTWRYSASSGHRFRALAVFVADEPVGYAVFSVRKQGPVLAGFITELEVVNEHAIHAVRALISAVANVARRDGAVLLSSLTVPRSLEASVLRRSGFVLCPGRLMPRALFAGCQVLSGNDQFNEICAKPDSWYLSWGDHDAV